MKYIIYLAMLALIACSKTTEMPIKKDSQVNVAPVQKAKKQVLETPHPTYCYTRVAQIGSEPQRGESCEVNAGGSSAFMPDLDRPERNSVHLSISSSALEKIGIGDFSFIHYTFDLDPNFKLGVETMDQVRVEWWEVTDMPNNMGFASDATGENNLFSHTSIDAKHIRERIKGQIDLSGYEISSAQLSINRAEDIPLDKDAAEAARLVNMVMGEQYIEGTLTISLIPMGSQGKQLGPTTFEFGTLIDWGYVKDIN